VADLASLAALGTTPIAGPNPAGVSARYEADFEKLSAEIAKLESVDGRNSMHWDTVVESATAVLSEKSKDLLVASYLTLGLLQMDGYRGLAAGLTLCKNMLNTFWDGLFPEVARLRARAQALQWMADRVAPVLAERPSASKSDQEPLTAADEALKEIDTLIASKIEEGAPSFQECQRALGDKLSSIPGDEPPPSETVQSSGSESAPQEQAAPPEIDSPKAAWDSLTPMRERRIKAAEVFRGANAADPLPYRLLRQAVWEPILEAPPAPEGVSAWNGGGAAFAADQEAALDKGDYAAVISACEARLVGDPAWLDLNFFVAKAMEGLGKPYVAAKRAVGDAVAHFVRGFPTLLDIKFADGTPMASEGTRLWILHELSALPEKGKAGAAGGLETAVTEARKLIARKNFREGTALLEKEMRSALTRRERFVVKLALARLCVEGGRSDLALPQLEGLDEEARKFALEEWEPGLVAEVARELWRCHKSSAAPEKATEFYQRLCRLDLGAALAMDGKK